MEQPATLTIERWTNAYRVPADHPDPEDLRARLDRLVSAQVVDACRRRLAPLIDESDRSVWLIRRVDVDMILDASAIAADRTSTAWGEQLAVEIRRVLDGGPSGDAVLHFRDQAAFVAQWVRDAAAGRAGGKWYYEEFDSLGSLPAGAAIAEAIVRSDEAAEIVQRLQTQGALEAVLAVLMNGDARRICDRVLPAGGGRGSVSARWVARVLALWNGVALSRGDDDGKDALRLLAAVKSEWPDGGAAGDAELRAALDGLLELRRICGQFDSADEALAFLRAVIAGDDAAFSAFAPQRLADLGAVADFVRSVAGSDAEWAQYALSVIGSAAAGDNRQSEACFLSELGGIFLLAGAVADLGVGEAIRAAAQSCEDALRAEPLLRFLLAMRCLGRERAALAVGDGAIAAFANLERAPSLLELAEAQAEADGEAALALVMERWVENTGEAPNWDPGTEHLEYFALGEVFPELQTDDEGERAWARVAELVLRRFARSLPGFGKSSPEYLYRNFLSGTSQIRSTNDRMEVQLGSCPLAVVLHIAGAYRTVTLPWREGVEICLLAPTG